MQSTTVSASPVQRVEPVAPAVSAIAAEARRLYEAGILTFPASKDAKHPDRGPAFLGTDGQTKPRWKPEYYPPHGWPTPEQHRRMFAGADVERMFVVCGARSGNGTGLDFDEEGYMDEWMRAIPDDLYARLYIEQSQRSGGYHVAFKGETSIAPCVPARDADGKVRIEVRGEEAGFIAAPSVGYDHIQGDLANLPILTGEEVATLLDAATAFNEWIEPPKPEPKPRPIRLDGADEMPGERYNCESGQNEVLDLFEKHGWRIGRRGKGNVDITRPGATSEKSGDVSPEGITYIFSTNTQFKAEKGHPPFHVYATLEHDGNHSTAAKALSRIYDPPIRINAGQREKQERNTRMTASATALVALGAIRKESAPPFEGSAATTDAEVAQTVLLPEDEAFERSRGDIWSALQNGVPPTKWLIADIVPAIGITGLYGRESSGKTWIALYVALNAARQGYHVLFIDEEAGLSRVAKRLAAMGATEADATRIHLFSYRTQGTLEEFAGIVHRYVKRHDIALALVDSVSKIIAAFGLKENDPGENTDLAAALFTPIASILGRAVLLLDHVPHGQDRPRGGSSKSADYDLAWYVEAIRDGSPLERGETQLTRKKDRDGTEAPTYARFAFGGDVEPEQYVQYLGPGRSMISGAGKQGAKERNECQAIIALYGEQNDGMRNTDWVLAIQERTNKSESTAKRTIDALLKAKAVELVNDLYKVTPLGYERHTPFLVENRPRGAFSGHEGFKTI